MFEGFLRKSAGFQVPVLCCGMDIFFFPLLAEAFADFNKQFCLKIKNRSLGFDFSEYNSAV